MTQGITKIPGQNPGGSTPQSLFPLDKIAFINGNQFRDHALNTGTPHQESSAPESYKNWINSLPPHLSKEGQHIIASWWSFELLSDVYNCGAAHTKLFGSQVDHTRRDHCIHAAYVAGQLSERALINLSPHERTVLELVMLLHDPHRLGSHALDRVIASIPGRPPIEQWGWGHDFHEYHGAQEVFKDRDLREILGKYWQDVLAVLSYPDTREDNDPTRLKDFGLASPTLSDGRIYLLYRLKDEIDRMSYLELDFRRSGFVPHLIGGLILSIQKYQEAFITAGNNLAVLLPHRPEEGYPFDPWIGARQLHREHIATHPTACLVDAVLQEALGQTIKSKFSNKINSEGCYKYVRNIALEGSYHKLFGTSVLETLRAPHARHETLGLEDLYAPLVTLTRDDLSDGPGAKAIGQYVTIEKSLEACGALRTDMSRLEYDLRKYLQQQGLDARVLMVLSNDFEKILEFKVVEAPAGPLMPQHFNRLFDLDAPGQSGELLDVVRLAVRSCPTSQKLIVAAHALDESGTCKNLRPIQDAIKRFFQTANVLKDTSTLETGYNHRAFCEPLDPKIFRPDVQQRMANFQPAWVTRGGCGLELPSQTPRT